MGKVFVITGPSGVGKGTLIELLLERIPELELSVSATTREPRPGEVDGRDYHFVSPEKFQQMVEADDFLEHATVFEHRYGTPKKPVMDALADGGDVLFDIDWQGTQQLKERAREDLVSVFILPPGHDELERRLKTRAQDSKEVVAKRMAEAASEISHWPEYDYVVVNRELDRALTQVKSILDAERSRRSRQIGVGEFVAGLTK